MLFTFIEKSCSIAFYFRKKTEITNMLPFWAYLYFFKIYSYCIFYFHTVLYLLNLYKLCIYFNILHILFIESVFYSRCSISHIQKTFQFPKTIIHQINYCTNLVVCLVILVSPATTSSMKDK